MAEQSQTHEESASFAALQSYPFHTDSEFANGLAVILGHPAMPATKEEMDREDDLVLQAKCFFYSRKEKLAPPLDFTAFKSWLASRSTNEPQESNARIGTPPGPSESPSSGQPTSNAAAANPREPAYPTSFAHIVELITTGQPIPGIQQIPDTVLDGHDITSEKPRRRKPWERVEAAPDEDRATSDPA